MRTLFLITARGGSKGIPRKNLCPIDGIPLVGFKAISARKSRYCTRLIISSDDQEIQDAARQFGAEVPFTRPPELATDSASSVDVIRHAIEWLEESGSDPFDAVMLLEPSSPFARAADYDAAIDMMIRRDANLVVAVRQVEVSSVFVGPMDSAGRITRIIDQMNDFRASRRQDAIPEFTPNGALYLFRWQFFKDHGALYADRDRSYGYLMDPHYSIEIDHPIDLAWARFLVEHGYVDMSHWR
jgi:N-acylneuraminate cytidylyltransferase/CMP-N,N'-diacetyllegionaminic acid synthase